MKKVLTIFAVATLLACISGQAQENTPKAVQSRTAGADSTNGVVSVESVWPIAAE